MRLSTFIFSVSVLSLLTTASNSQSKIPVGFKQYKTKVFANEKDWVGTGINIKRSDFVIFEAFGKVTLGSTLVQGEVSAVGSLSTFALIFNKYPSTRHGALLCKNSDQIIETKGTETMWKLLDPIEKKYWSAMEEDFIGFYFVSKDDQELKFVVNDKDFSNNKGYFDITVTVIPLKVHQQRNQYNKCPLKEPTCNEDITDISSSEKKYPFDDIYRCVDIKKYTWIRADHEWFFHGGIANINNYKTYRGESSQILGCQCTYNKDGELVNDEYMGTFDYAFALKSLENPMKYHTLWDVFSHNAFIEYFNEENETFKYNNTKTRY